MCVTTHKTIVVGAEKHEIIAERQAKMEGKAHDYLGLLLPSLI